MKYRDKKLGRYRKGVTPLPKHETFMMVAKYDGTCFNCGRRIQRGTNMMYTPSTKTTEHVNCEDHQ